MKTRNEFLLPLILLSSVMIDGNEDKFFVLTHIICGNLPSNILSLVMLNFAVWLIIDRIAVVKQGYNALGSVYPSVCPSVYLFVCAGKSNKGNFKFLCVCNQGAYMYNHADAVDQL